MSLTVGTDSFIGLSGADEYMKARLHSEGWPITWDTEPLHHSDLPRGSLAEQPSPFLPAPVDTANPEYLRRVDTKERALKLATAILCRQSYRGCIASLSQTLAFPRAGIADREGRPLSPSQIPPEIGQATAELALFLILNDITDETIRRNVFGIRQSRIGEASVTYEASAPHVEGLPWVVLELIEPYLKTAGASAPLVH